MWKSQTLDSRKGWPTRRSFSVSKQKRPLDLREDSFNLFRLLLKLDLCGTPGYLAPETLKCNMWEKAPGYSKEVDVYVWDEKVFSWFWEPSIWLLHFLLQLGLWSYFVHSTGGMPSVLASKANGNAEEYHGGKIQLHITRMGRHIW